MARGGLATVYAPPLDLPFRFMALGLAWFGLLVGMYPWHIHLLLGSFYDPHLLTFVHVNTLGVIAAIVFGASYQMLPVVLGVPIASVRWARLSWWVYLPALPLFLLGLSQGWLVALAVGGALLFGALSLYVSILVVTLWRTADRSVVFWHIAVSIAGLAVGASLGLLLALSKQLGFLGGQTLPILGAHATLMLGGWIVPLLMGVAYRLVGMFTLTEDRLRNDWAWLGLICAATGAWTLAASVLIGQRSVAIVGASSLLLGLGVFGCQLARLYVLRVRRTFDVHIPYAISGAISGLLAIGLVLSGLLSERAANDPVFVAAGWLAIAGWAQTPMQGFLYKIGTFLTWLYRYAPVAGREPVPMLEDLYSRRVAVAGWAAWTAGVALAAGAALSGQPTLATAGALLLSAGAGSFLINAIRVGWHWLPRSAQLSTLSKKNIT